MEGDILQARQEDRNYRNSKEGIISTLFKCSTEDAKYLYIYDAAAKLKKDGEYDIGGAYENGPEFWFFFTVSLCPGCNNLLSLYVCHRRRGSFSISISDSNELKHKDLNVSHTRLPDTLKTYAFNTVRPDETYFLKTFCFSKKQVKELNGQTLLIPIKIRTNCSTIDDEVLEKIKESNNHKLHVLLQNQKTDFVLVSQSGKEYSILKLLLLAQGPMLRHMVRDLSSLKLDISDEDMELLIEFLSTGTIHNLEKHESLSLLDLAQKYEMHNLYKLFQCTLIQRINVENAIDMVILAGKYQLEDLETKASSFIKDHPEVLETEKWNNLNNVEITKKMFKIICQRN